MHVRRAGTARVCSAAPDGNGRVLVRCEEGSRTQRIAPSRLTALFGRDGHQALLVCAETSEFRALAASQMLPRDSCLELGCSFGDTTVILAKTCAALIAIDNSLECIERCRARCAAAPACRVELSNAVEVCDQAISFGRSIGASVVFVDLGGNRAASAVVPLLLRLQTELSPRLIVVKCRALHAAAKAHEARVAAAAAAATATTSAASVAAGAKAGTAGAAPPGSAGAAHNTATTPTAEATGRACFAAPDRTGVLRESGCFWREALAHCAQLETAPESLREAAPQPASQPAAEAVPKSKPRQMLAGDVAAAPPPICFDFLNRGRCARAVCTFLHVRPDDPEAVADRQKRAAIGWQPNRVQQQLAARAAGAKRDEQLELAAPVAAAGGRSEPQRSPANEPRPPVPVPEPCPLREWTWEWRWSTVAASIGQAVATILPRAFRAVRLGAGAGAAATCGVLLLGVCIGCGPTNPHLGGRRGWLSLRAG